MGYLDLWHTRSLDHLLRGLQTKRTVRSNLRIHSGKEVLGGTQLNHRSDYLSHTRLMFVVGKGK